MARDKANLDIFWLRDESLEDSDNLPDPDVLAREIVEELEAALEQFKESWRNWGEKRIDLHTSGHAPQPKPRCQGGRRPPC